MERWFLFSVLILFSLISVVTLSSVSVTRVPDQIISFLLAGCLFLVVSRLHFQSLVKKSWIFYIGLILLLTIPLLMDPIRNTHRWVFFLGFTLQPSQFAVPISSLFLIYVTQRYALSTLKGFLAALTTIALPATLILVEPDLGTALVFCLVQFLVLFVANLPWKYISLLAFGGLALAIFSWFFVLQPYQKQRITSFTSKEQHSSDTYNVTQAIIAVGSGGMYGKGLGKGSQSQLAFLPERETDFIFSAYAEEFGYVGTVLLICIYISLLFYIGYHLYHTELAKKMYLTGTFSLFLIQTSIHLLMNMGLSPVTGVTLPLVSHGGSSLLGFALLLSMSQTALTHQSNFKNTLHIS